MGFFLTDLLFGSEPDNPAAQTDKQTSKNLRQMSQISQEVWDNLVRPEAYAWKDYRTTVNPALRRGFLNYLGYKPGAAPVNSTPATFDASRWAAPSQTLGSAIGNWLEESKGGTVPPGTTLDTFISKFREYQSTGKLPTGWGSDTIEDFQQWGFKDLNKQLQGEWQDWYNAPMGPSTLPPQSAGYLDEGFQTWFDPAALGYGALPDAPTFTETPDWRQAGEEYQDRADTATELAIQDAMNGVLQRQRTDAGRRGMYGSSNFLTAEQAIRNAFTREGAKEGAQNLLQRKAIEAALRTEADNKSVTQANWDAARVAQKRQNLMDAVNWLEGNARLEISPYQAVNSFGQVAEGYKGLADSQNAVWAQQMQARNNQISGLFGVLGSWAGGGFA